MRYLVVLFSLVSSFAFGQAITYIQNPLATSLSQSLVGPFSDSASRDKVNLYPERQTTPLLENRGDVRFSFMLQNNNKAPLVFIIPGTGGSSEARSAHFIAEKLFALGYHTVTIDNPFSWNFAVAGSRTGLPGYLPNDAEDLHKVLKLVSTTLKSKQGISPSSFSLVGFSLGGLVSLFLEQTNVDFQFKKVLIVNPPLDLLYAANKLDSLYLEGSKLSRAHKEYVFNRVLEIGQPLLNNPKAVQDQAFMQKTFDRLNLTQQEMAYLIGNSFRDGLRDLIFASQQVHDLGILKAKATEYHRNDRYNEAKNFSFVDYLNFFVYPNIKMKNGILQEVDGVNHNSSMYQFADLIKSNKNIYLIHSADDFILKPGDTEWLQNTFGDRALILPYGGHCGAMSFQAFLKQLKAVFELGTN
ncbi:MAG: alpha/beta hydrolase [Bdellovibrionaceae bacterium]|nr:alpha/beta hydrolase [Pseudobdellovibrionaceae bacterium]